MVITKTLDVKLAGSQWITEAVKGEANARTLHIAFEEEGSSLSLENVAHAYLYARKPSGQYSLINSCTINADNTIDYVETAQTCAEQGIMLCTLVLVDEDGATLYSPQFTIHIFPNELDQSGIVSASEFTAINEQVASADDSRKRAEAWAVGTMDGEPVPSDDETYENNSKYYAEQAEQIKNDTQDIADDVGEIRDDVLAIKEQAQEIVDDAVDKVIDMTATAHQISVNAQPTVSKTGGDSTPINLDFGMPAPNGIKSIVKTQTVGLNDIYKITFTNNNTFEYVVKNGKDGVDGQDGQDGRDGRDGDVQSDGLYPELAVGTATALIDKNSYTSNTSPYLYRQSPSGKRCEYDVIGGTVGWNQLLDPTKLTNDTVTGITVTANQSTGEITVSGTATADTSARVSINGSITFQDGHTYFMSQPSGASANTYFLRANGGTFYRFNTIAKETGTTQRYLRIFVANGTTVNFTFTPIIIDLTTLLGSTIADYAYQLEQTTAGSGIAWLKSFGFLSKDYYEYCEPTLESVQATERVARGINQWDEEWELGTISNSTGEDSTSTSNIRTIGYTEIIPNTQYYVYTPTALGFRYYDSQKNFIGSVAVINGSTPTTPTNARYLRFVITGVTTYANNVCINLSNPTINGQYFPYDSHTYPLGNTTLRGIPKLDSNNNIYYDGDVYKADGTVARKYGVVDASTLDWVLISTGTYPYFRVDDATKFWSSSQGIILLGYDNLGSMGGTDFGNLSDAKGYSLGTSSNTRYFKVRNTSCATVEALKTALNGVYLVYELATPTTETTSPYAPIQYTGSTEEFTTDNDVPVGVDAKYYTDMGGGNGTEYTAGTGIAISNNTISINTSGASTGQVLKKTANGVGWANESSGTNWVAPIAVTNKKLNHRTTFTAGQREITSVKLYEYIAEMYGDKILWDGTNLKVHVTQNAGIPLDSNGYCTLYNTTTGWEPDYQILHWEFEGTQYITKFDYEWLNCIFTIDD